MTDITLIRTHEGWLHLSAVIDLFSKQVIVWSMGHPALVLSEIWSAWPQPGECRDGRMN